MKLLDKIKNAIFEEDEEFDETLAKDSVSFSESKIKEIKKESKKENKIETEEPLELVKKIDIEKTVSKKEIKNDLEEQPKIRREMRRTTPIVFEEEDFEYEKPIVKPKVKPISEPVKKDDSKKILYGGYKDDKPKEKFKPSPIISPVYGFVGVSPVLEHKRNDAPKENHVFTPEEPEKMSLEEVRMKAYGGNSYVEEEDEDIGLLYEIEKDEAPAISKVTLGDAEEYFEDLGLEYNIDYKDDAKEKEMRKGSKTTRSTKNKELSDTVDQEIKEEIEKELESTKDLEITREQLKPKTADEIRKVKKIDDMDLKNAKIDDEEIDEKNLYDLIDMMYDSK